MKFPILRYALFFILGIISYPYFSNSLIEHLNLLFFFPLIVFLSQFILKDKKHRALLAGTSALVLLFLSGLSVCIKNDSFRNSDHLLNYQSSIKAFSGVIIEGPRDTPKTHSYLLQADHLVLDSGLISCNGLVKVYIRKSDSSITYSYGDRLFLNSKPSRIEGPKNPHDFDYKAFMANKNVYFSAFSESQKVRLISVNNGNPIYAFSYTIRNYLEVLLEQNFIKTENVQLAKALLIGQKKDLNSEIKESFSDSGAIHVLAVSGLHVGIIYQILLFVLSFLKKSKFGELIIFAIVIIFLFSYALITGFSPSVSRSVLMFSLIAFSQLINRQSNIYNTLALAALLLLIINPNFIYELGFQLSFAAVFSIVFFYPYFNSIVEIENDLLRKVYQLMSVSIAAQIGTLPITLYYFHQFPNLFLLTNILVIPFSGLILSLGMAFFALHIVPVLEGIIAGILEFAIALMLKGVNFISEIPFSVSREIPFRQQDFLIAVIMLFVVALALSEREKKWLYTISFVLLLAAILQLNRKIEITGQSELVVFNSDAGHIAIVEGDRMALSSVENSDSDSLFNKYSLIPFKLAEGITMTDSLSPFEYFENEKGKFWFEKGLQIAYPKMSFQFKKEANWIFIDRNNYMLLSKSSFNPRKGFILGNNIPFFIKSKIVEKLIEESRAFHDLNADGALVINTNGKD